MAELLIGLGTRHSGETSWPGPSQALTLGALVLTLLAKQM